MIAAISFPQTNMQTRLQVTNTAGNTGDNTCSVSNSSPVHVFEPFFWTSHHLDNFRLKARAIFNGSIFNADPHELQVT